MNTLRRILTSALTLAVCSCICGASGLVPSGGTKTLVAYFSATGNTRAVANRIAGTVGADIYEIEPSHSYAANPYDDSDLIQNEAYNDLHPAVSNLPSQETIARYDTIYVGSPLWWHQPAMVVCTFLDAYDLTGKVVVPFITYGATTYLNEAMQKLFKCTPNSIHVPAELPEDLDPGNIREPQYDDDGIDLPNHPSQVEGWLERMGLWPPKDNSGISGISTEHRPFSLRTTPDGIAVSVDSPAFLTVYDLTGRERFMSGFENDIEILLGKGVYIVNLKNNEISSSTKIVK